MKVLAILLLCAFAAVQGRSAGGQESRAVAALGENPWVVHLRIAVSTSGLLNSCVGSLIGSGWVLTAASCVSDARFIWTRYGAVNVINPELVTESSATRINGQMALLPIGRPVESSVNISPVSLVSSEKVAGSARFCGFGGENGVAGEQLSCFDVTTEEDGSVTASNDDGVLTEFDLGAPLVSEGVQIGVLVAADGSSAGTFLPVADYIDWIEGETNLSFSRAAAAPAAAPEDDALRVKFVN